VSLITKLQVIYVGWGERWPLGTLAQAGRDLIFEYSAQAIEYSAQRGLQFSALHAPISKDGTMAIQGPAHLHGLPGFIADALPDGWGMLLMDRVFRKAGRDPAGVSVLERLAVVGHGAMGALAFEPTNALEAQQLGVVRLQALAKEMQGVLRDDDNITSEERLRQLLLLGGSPQGARPKALLRYSDSNKQFYAESARDLPKDSMAWLVKFPAQSEKSEVCAVEEFYARLARQGGMAMPDSMFLDLGRHAAFAVKRFDRVKAPAEELRVPQQSLAAFLHADYRLPSLDYETVLLATQRITADYRETLKAFERCVFNVLTHNRDDHAKNFAFSLNQDNRWLLSPAFDLTFSQGPGGEHFTSIAGEGKRPSRAHLLHVAKRGGLKEKDALRVIAHWKEALQPSPKLLDGLPISRSTMNRLAEVLRDVWRAL
jgi:serine/threonine-protein kinase HipA